MSNSLDMSLDQIIRKNSYRPKPSHTFKPHRRKTFSSVCPQPYAMPLPIARQELEYTLMPVQGFGGESGTRLYVSNLDSDVSNGDIKLLFSEVGELTRYSIHYDKSGRSKGTAEVVYARHSDAVAAINRYNNNNLDGKPMKIEIVGANALVCSPMPSAPASSFTYPTFNYSSTRVKAHPGFSTSKMDYENHGGRHGYGRGRWQPKQNEKKVVTAEELDADLEKFRAEGTRSK